MTGSEAVRSVEAASLSISPVVATAIRDAGTRDDRFSTDLVARTARQVVAAWALAVDGDTVALAAIAQPDALHWLLHPSMESWGVAAGPVVTQIEV
jgi:hypothetical protein